MDQGITVESANRANDAFKRLCMFALRMLALYLVVYYAGHIGITLDELAVRCCPGWCYGIFRTICVICSIGLYTAVFQPRFEGIMGLKGFKAALPVMLIFTPGVIASVLRFETLSLEPETVIELVSVAVAEEMEFRAAVCSFGMKHVKSKAHIVPLAVASGIFFGLNHLSNVVAGQSTSGTIMQVVLTSCAGILYAAVFLNAGTIWPTCIMHFVHNYICVSMSDGSLDVDTSSGSYSILGVLLVFAIGSVYLLIAGFLLRDSRKQDILDLWARRWNKSSSLEVKPGRDVSNTIICSVMIIAMVTAGLIGINELTAHLYKDVLGCNGYYSVSERSDGFKTVTFYEGLPFSKNKQTIALAYGYTDVNCTIIDIDDDGELEIACSASELEDGSDVKLLVYKRINGELHIGTMIFSEGLNIPEGSRFTVLNAFSLGTGEAVQILCYVSKDSDGHISYYRVNSDYIRYKRFEGFNTGEQG